MRPTAYRHLLKFSAALFLLAAFLISPALPGAEAKIIYVTQDGTGARGGDSWTNSYDAKRFFNSLNNDPLITAGDEYRVAKGTYSPISTDFVINRTNSFKLKSGVKLYGGFAGPGAADPNYRNLVTHETILSGELSPGINSYHVVVASGTDSTALLDGFTITKGIADGGGNNNFGGGLLSETGNAMIRYCTFRENSAASDGGGAYLDGGNVTLESCTFSQNTANTWGGGARLENTNSLIQNCTFSKNHALEYGGALELITASPTLINCTFFDNLADRSGGALINFQSNPVIVNCTFSANTAADQGNGMYNFEGDPVIMNSIFWNGGTSEIYTEVSPEIADVAISDSVVKGGFAGGTNIITTDPQLAALANNGGPTMTCALPEGSSAVDKGQPVGTTVSGSVTVPDTDQRGVTRPQGSGVDIGAFEREVSPTPGGGGGGCQSTTPAGAAWLMIPLALVLLRRKE